MSSADSGTPAASASRRLLHTRTIVVDVYERDDGGFDLAAQLTDVKHHDLQLASGLRPAGLPVHDMHLSVSVDADFNVLNAHGASPAVPYAGICDTIGPAYAALKGLNLLNKFRQSVMKIIGGTRGCTHLSELAGVLPTAAVQAAAGIREDKPGVQPFQLDRCHALVLDGEGVRRFYPRWYRAREQPSPAHDDDTKSAAA